MRIPLAASLLALATALHSADFHKTVDQLMQSDIQKRLNLAPYGQDEAHKPPHFFGFQEAHPDGVKITERKPILMTAYVTAAEPSRIHMLDADIPAPDLKPGNRANKVNPNTEGLVSDITRFLGIAGIDHQIVSNLNELLFDNKTHIADLETAHATVEVKFEPKVPAAAGVPGGAGGAGNPPMFILTFMAK